MVFAEKEKNYLGEIEELKTQLSARNAKYQQLKKNYIVIVSNNGKDATRARDAAVKKVCIDNDIPLSKCIFADVPSNEDVPDIEDSEEEYEEYEEEISGSEAERNDEDNLGKN